MFGNLISLCSNWYALDVFAAASSTVRHNVSLTSPVCHHTERCQLLQPQQPEGGLQTRTFTCTPGPSSSQPLPSSVTVSPFLSLPLHSSARLLRGTHFIPNYFSSEFPFGFVLNISTHYKFLSWSAQMHSTICCLLPRITHSHPAAAACLSLLDVSQHTNLMSRRSSAAVRDISFHNMNMEGSIFFIIQRLVMWVQFSS